MRRIRSIGGVNGTDTFVIMPVLLPHMGLTTGGTIGATSAKTLVQSARLIGEWAEAARKVRKDVIVIAHGGPVSMPEDVAYLLEHSPHCNGLCGASSMERLPIEVAIKAHVERYKRLCHRTPGPARGKGSNAERCTLLQQRVVRRAGHHGDAIAALTITCASFRMRCRWSSSMKLSAYIL